MINMLGMIDQTFATHKIQCTNYAQSDYNDDGDWVDGIEETFPAIVNLQPIDREAVTFLVQNGGTVDIQQAFTLHLNNGKQIYHPRQTTTGVISASTIIADFQGYPRTFKVLYADNRPWHNYCMAHVEMLKDA